MMRTKRVYAVFDRDDGFRILVERLWPRGMSKERSQIDLWLKDIAPSPELRKWFAHDPAKWEQFQKRYWVELQNNASVKQLKQNLKAHQNVTLVYAARDEEHNSAIALKKYIERIANQSSLNP